MILWNFQCTENDVISRHITSQVYTVDQLRLDKLEKLNESNPKGFSTIPRNELRYTSDGMYCERVETKKISVKLDNGLYFSSYSYVYF